MVCERVLTFAVKYQWSDGLAVTRCIAPGVTLICVLNVLLTKCNLLQLKISAIGIFTEFMEVFTDNLLLFHPIYH